MGLTTRLAVKRSEKPAAAKRTLESRRNLPELCHPIRPKNGITFRVIDVHDDAEVLVKQVAYPKTPLREEFVVAWGTPQQIAACLQGEVRC